MVVALVQIMTALEDLVGPCSDTELRKAWGKAVGMLDGPEDYGAQPDEHRFRIDNYWPAHTEYSRKTGEKPSNAY